jgi:hypothetical protein
MLNIIDSDGILTGKSKVEVDDELLHYHYSCYELMEWAKRGFETFSVYNVMPRPIDVTEGIKDRLLEITPLQTREVTGGKPKPVSIGLWQFRYKRERSDIFTGNAMDRSINVTTPTFRKLLEVEGFVEKLTIPEDVSLNVLKTRIDMQMINVNDTAPLIFYMKLKEFFPVISAECVQHRKFTKAVPAQNFSVKKIDIRNFWD